MNFQSRTRKLFIAIIFGCLMVLAARADYFTNAVPMGTARAAHSSALLSNGKVLMIGGYDNNFVVTNGTEIYDCTNGTWANAAPMSFKRAGATATVLQNGKVLVAGGFSSVSSSENATNAELYDVATGGWTTTGPLNIPRYDHTATLLANGKVLVAGGDATNGLAAFAELYDPNTGNWTLTGNMVFGRESHSATLLPTGKVLIVGGYASSGKLSSAELYDPATGNWTATTPYPTAVAYHTSTLLLDGKVLVAGGLGTDVLTNAYLYDATTENWTATGYLKKDRYTHTAVLLSSGKVLVVGGQDESSKILGSADLYDPNLGTWNLTDSMKFARAFPQAILLPNNQVLITGGRTTAAADLYVLSNAELFVTAATTLPPIVLHNPTFTLNGAIQFGFTNLPGTSFTILATTNVSLPFSNWGIAGTATEISPGQFQFSDPLTNLQRFYRIRSP